MSFLAATRIEGVSCSVVYYGGQIVPYKDETAKAPLQMHFGDMDAGIPMEDVDQIKAAQPQADVHVYHADHGFNCDHRSQYDEESCKIARESAGKTVGLGAAHCRSWRQRVSRYVRWSDRADGNNAGIPKVSNNGLVDEAELAAEIETISAEDALGTRSSLSTTKTR